ncbi:MAG: hypothetical protein ACE5JE_06455 [Thermoplasmata archaeon]
MNPLRRPRLRRKAEIAILATGVVLLTMTALAWNPVHRSPIRVQDPLEDDIPPDYNAVLLQGVMDGDTLVITLSVEGTVQPSRYIVNVVGRTPGPEERPNIYKLEYVSDAERSYGIPASREADVLTFLFPLSLLFEGAFIVGLEAVIFTPGDPIDFVQEGPREDLVVHSLLPLPLDPLTLFAAGAGLAVLGVLGLIAFSRTGPPPKSRGHSPK